MERKTAPYGTWHSPISPDDFAAGSSIFEGVQVNVSLQELYWEPSDIREGWKDISWRYSTS